MHVCGSEEDALNQLFEGELTRSYAAHELNSHSSRSHSIYTLHIESRSRVESTEKIVYSKLHLVDLAGSERGADTTDNDKKTRNEGREINTSLLALKECIRALD